MKNLIKLNIIFDVLVLTLASASLLYASNKYDKAVAVTSYHQDVKTYHEALGIIASLTLDAMGDDNELLSVYAQCEPKTLDKTLLYYNDAPKYRAACKILNFGYSNNQK